MTSVGTARARRPSASISLGGRLEGFGAAGGEDDVGAVLGEDEGGAAADAGAAAGDDRDPAGEVEPVHQMTAPPLGAMTCPVM